MELKRYLEENFCLGAVNTFAKKSTKLIVYSSLLNSMFKKIKSISICSWAVMLPSQFKGGLLNPSKYKARALGKCEKMLLNLFFL